MGILKKWRIQKIQGETFAPHKPIRCCPQSTESNPHQMKRHVLFISLLLASSLAQAPEEPEMEMEVNANEEEEPLQPRFLTSLLGNLAQKHHNPNKHYYVAPVTTVGSYPPPYEGYDTFPAYVQTLPKYRPYGGSYRPFVAVSKPYFFSRVRRPVYIYQPAVLPANPITPVKVDDVVIEPISQLCNDCILFGFVDL